ncbi:MAG: hypothetical protein KF718_16290 [Polyangiaceae bacterium]|nr:hypothetical protein [Polyangiaceae bacterium]
MQQNVYDQVEAIAINLETAGFSLRARTLRDAIAAGATGGEIQMALRFHLQAILREELSVPEEMKQSIRGLVATLNVSLGDE